MRNNSNIKRLTQKYFERVRIGIENARNKSWIKDYNKITWTEKTFNVVWGCTKVSPGCRNCYAASMSKRLGFSQDGEREFLWGKSGITASGKGWMMEKGRRIFPEANLQQLIQWNRMAEANNSMLIVFIGNMNDMFEDHPVTRRELAKLWDVVRETPNIHYQFLTKRPENIRECLPKDWFDFDNGYPNVWLGCSIENQSVAFRFDKYLADIPAPVKFISYEPAIGPLTDLRWDKLDWIIAGGESGPGHRPLDLQWAREVRDLAAKNNVTFFFKQSAHIYPGRGTKLDGVQHYNFPMPKTSTLQNEIGLAI